MRSSPALFPGLKSDHYCHGDHGTDGADCAQDEAHVFLWEKSHKRLVGFFSFKLSFVFEDKIKRKSLKRKSVSQLHPHTCRWRRFGELSSFKSEKGIFAKDIQTLHFAFEAETYESRTFTEHFHYINSWSLKRQTGFANLSGYLLNEQKKILIMSGLGWWCVNNMFDKLNTMIQLECKK